MTVKDTAAASCLAEDGPNPERRPKRHGREGDGLEGDGLEGDGLEGDGLKAIALKATAPKRFQNLRYGAKHVLLLSPNLDDDEMPLNWPEDKKMLVLFIFNAKEQMNQRSSNRRSNEVMSSVERVIVLHFVH